MKTQLHTPISFEFYVADVDTLVLVEDTDREVVVRTTRNSFSQKRKSFFIRELATEGFIPDRYQWLSDADSSLTGVRWIVDHSWVRVPEAILASSRKFMTRLLAGAGVLGMGCVLVIFLYSF